MINSSTMFIQHWTWIILALTTQKHQDEAVLKIKDDARFEKFKTFRVIVNSEINKLASFLVDNHERFIEQFDKKMINQAEDFIKHVEASRLPDTRLLERARDYMNHLMTPPINVYIPTRNGSDTLLKRFCADSITLVQEPPNLLKKYANHLPTSAIHCRQILTRHWSDSELIDFVTINDTKIWAECEQYANKVREIELQSFQDFIDMFIIAANNARN